MEGDIKFDEPRYAYARNTKTEPSWLTRLVIRLGLATDEAGAQKTLIIILIICVLATIGVWMFSGGSPEVVPPPPTA